MRTLQSARGARDRHVRVGSEAVLLEAHGGGLWLLRQRRSPLRRLRKLLLLPPATLDRCRHRAAVVDTGRRGISSSGISSSGISSSWSSWTAERGIAER
jgi:hypothetical protein